MVTNRRMRNRSTLTAAATLLLIAACEEAERSPLAPADTDEPTAEPVATDVRSMLQFEGYPEPGERAQGWMIGRYGAPQEVTYQIHEGLAIWEGDIVLGPANAIARSESELRVDASGPDRAVVNTTARRWPGGVVPYTISTASTANVLAAIEIVEDQSPGVVLVPRTTETDYVTFRDASGCSSPIGRQGGQQFINLSVTGCSIGSGAHEILHAIGVWHEHTRCDRDNFVTINYANVTSGRELNFWKAGSDDAADECGDVTAVTDVGPYDFGSIMHYSLGAFSNGGGNTITPIVAVPPGVTIGQRTGFSAGDAAGVDFMYGTNNAAPSISLGPLDASYPEGSNVPFDASGTTDADDDDDLIIFAWTFGDGTCPGPAACSAPAPGHTYLDNGDYSWSVTASDGFDGTGTGGSIEITNVAPSVEAGTNVALTSGDDFNFSGSFSDPGIEDDPWSWVITWNDGREPETTAGSTSDQSLPITATRQVCAAGDYSVGLQVTDKDGGVGQDNVTVSVAYVAVEIVIEPGPEGPNPINLKRGGVVPVAILSSPTVDATTLDPATLQLGDGTDPDTPVAMRGNGYQTAIEDVDGDGLLDRIAMFRIPDLVAGNDLDENTTSLVLRGFQEDGCVNVRGEDDVTIRP